ncbi:MAG: hypothetical protein ABIA75_08475 [Candidatus Neomarinimicrobiota bacterium]
MKNSRPRSPLFLLTLSLVLYSGCGSNYSPESFYIEAQVDTTIATIGDVIDYRIWVHGAGKRVVEFLNWEVDSSRLEIRDRRELTGEYRDDYGLAIGIAVWDTGRLEIPAFPVRITVPETGDSFILTTDPVPIRVQSLIGATTQSGLRPIKGPVPVRFPWPWKTMLYISLLFTLMATLVLLWRRRFVAPVRPGVATVPTEPADVIALAKLKRLGTDRPWEKGRVKDYYFDLSYLLREYVENSVYIKTLEMTTTEIEENRRLLPFPTGLVDEWLEMLKRSDLIKFARQIPTPEICRTDLDQAGNFIAATVSIWKQNSVADSGESKFESPTA